MKRKPDNWISSNILHIIFEETRIGRPGTIEPQDNEKVIVGACLDESETRIIGINITIPTAYLKFFEGVRGLEVS